MINWSEKDIEKLIKDFYSGRVSLKRLPVILFNAYLELFKNATKDLGVVTPTFEDAIYKNVRLFAGAKTYQYSYATIGNLYDAKGNLVPLKDFIELGKQTFNTYNETWLKTEYGFAQTQAENIKSWNEETEVNDLLEYVAVLDSKTSEICKHLDGIILPKTDIFWLTHSPANHYNCRCLIIGADGEKATSKAKVQSAMSKAKVSPQMQFNPALAREVFPSSHPYFDINPLDKKYVNDLYKKVEN